MRNVHIKICDKGWIIEKMAAELVKGNPGITYGLEENPNAELTYYLPYLTFCKRISRYSLGFFTHLEEADERREKFFAVAREMDHCVAQSIRYARRIEKDTQRTVSIISPGVDHDKFSPVLKLGVVGRTYDSGRKGEDLVRQLLNIRGIQWYFTGSGWPLEPLDLSDEEMPAFYNNVDYVVVPSLYEGGPMCVLEALACGKEVIAPAIGWIDEFPHIPFEKGNVASLRVRFA